MAHAHIHILGSRAGYTTLDATPGVTTAERAELEVLSFGDATNAEAMTRLETHASMIGRRLRSGRFAISRMLPGGTDDAGRPTIEVVSLLVDLASYTAILGALARLASDARLWRVARGAVSRGFEVPEEPVQITASDPRVLRAFDAWIAARKQGATAVLGAGDEPGLFAMVALLDTDDLAACRWGVGVLSLSAPVDVCTLAPTTAAIGPRPVLRASTAHAQPWLNAEMAAAEEHAARNPLLPPSTSLAQAVRIEPAFDRPARATPAWDAEPVGHDPQPRRKSLLPIAAVSAACSLALLAVMAVAYARGGRAVASGDFDRQSATATESALGIEAPSTAPLQASGYSLIPEVAPPPPPVADRDGDGVADEVDECPDLAGGFLMDYYLDEDGDNLGSGEPVRLCTAPGGSTPAQSDGRRYASTNGDECPDHPDIQTKSTFYLDKDGDQLGDPNESDRQCVLKPAAPWVNNCADTDDNVARSEVGGTGNNPESATDDAQLEGRAEEAWIEARRLALVRLQEEVSEIRNDIAALPPGMQLNDHVSDLGAMLKDLKQQTDAIQSLQKYLHSEGPIRAPSIPHRFVGDHIWSAICDKRECLMNEPLAGVWMNILRSCQDIVEQIESSRERYIAHALHEAVSSPGKNDRNRERLRKHVRDSFDLAIADGPRRLLSRDYLEAEIRWLEAHIKAAKQ